MYDQLFKGTDTLGPNASVARQFGNTGKLSSNFYSAAELSVGHLAALLKCAVWVSLAAECLASVEAAIPAVTKQF